METESANSCASEAVCSFYSCENEWCGKKINKYIYIYICGVKCSYTSRNVKLKKSVEKHGCKMGGFPTWTWLHCMTLLHEVMDPNRCLRRFVHVWMCLISHYLFMISKISRTNSAVYVCDVVEISVSIHS